VKRDKKMDGSELELALKELVATEGVNASAVVTRDGIMVEFLTSMLKRKCHHCQQ